MIPPHVAYVEEHTNMKQSTFIAILLTFLMFLLLLTAAVVFLAQRNQEFEQIAEVRATDEATLITMSEQMASDLAVRQAAIESAEATREALSGQVTAGQQEIEKLEEELDLKSTDLSQAGSDLQELAVQLFIFSPKEGAVVPPLEPLELFFAASSESGLESLEITIDDELLAQYPAEGQLAHTVRTEWTPADEVEYVISAVANDSDGNSSQPQTVNITAAFSSPAARSMALQRQTEADVRDLRFPEPLEAALLPEATEASPLDIHRWLLTGHSAESPQDLATSMIMLKALDLLPAEVDPGSLVDPDFNGNLLAFYDPDTSALIVYEPSDQPEAFGRWVHVHDYAHQILDETFRLEEIDLTSLDGDARMALRALAEGEATYLQYLYARGEYLEAEDQAEIEEGLKTATSDILDTAPRYLQDDFGFAYTDGLLFVQSLHEQDGYPAVNEAWLDPPESSEQILHPDRYLNGDSPLPVTLSLLEDAVDDNWQLVGEDTLGEFVLRQHLQQQELTPGQIDQATTGWGGGRYIVYQNENDDTFILVIRLAWDTPADGSEFASTYADYLGQRYDGEGTALPGGSLCWEGDDVTCLYTLSGDSLIIRAPDLESAAAIFATQ